jgi:ABC-type Fe3+/spermidine/putrescine transport system ATPase subunit
VTEIQQATPARRSGISSTPDAELRDAAKIYPDGTVAVDHVSLAIERGEFFSLLGPSGCGKSTTLRLIAGLSGLTSGEVFIRGEPMRGRRADKRPTNMVFQGLALFPHLTVAANIGFGPKLKRRPAAQIRDAVERMLDLVELSGYAGRYPHQLSGGQQQRVAIARALANEPAVLLLDEPLGALDLRLRVQMQQTLKNIQQSAATTFIYVTHDQTEALAMSDRLAVMNRGRIEQVGTPAELYAQPATRFVATFIGDTNLFEGDYRADRIDAGGLRIAVPRPGRVACVRPERVCLATTLPRSYVNTFSGVVEQVTLHGPTLRYRTRLDSGRVLLADLPNDAAQPRIVPGDPVQIGFDVDAVAVIAEPAPAEPNPAEPAPAEPAPA